MSVYVNLLVVDHQEIPACHVSLQECILAKDQCKIDEDQNKSSVYNLISWSFKERLQTKTTRVWKACQLCMFRFWGWISIIIHGHETRMSFWRASPNPEVLGVRYSITSEFTHLYPSSILESATSTRTSSWHFDLHQKSSLSEAKGLTKGWFLTNTYEPFDKIYHCVCRCRYLHIYSYNIYICMVYIWAKNAGIFQLNRQVWRCYQVQTTILN